MTPVEAIVKARRAGVPIALTEDGAVRADRRSLPAWLVEIHNAEPEAFRFALALVMAVERSQGLSGLEGLLTVQEIRIEATP